MGAVVMGGTSGIGLATARQLTHSGIAVTVTGRDQTRLDAAAAHVAGAERVDGTDFTAVSAFFDRFGSFEHLVLAFSPGTVGAGLLREVSAADFETAVTGKLFGYVHAIRVAQVSDSITVVSGASGHSSMPGTSALSAANGALERLIGPLAAELAPVRVNAVSPGVVDTAWWEFLPAEERAGQFSEWAQRTPVGRVGSAGDVAQAISYLISAGFVTGTILPVDGGLTLA